MMDFFKYGKELELRAAKERNALYQQQQDSLKEIRAKTQNLFDAKGLYAHKKEVEYILNTLESALLGYTPYKELWIKHREALVSMVKAIGAKIDYLQLHEKQPLITHEYNILAIKRAFDGFLWVEADPATFLDFWRHGAKGSYLPLMKGKTNSFVFLLDLLGLLGGSDEKPEGLTYAELGTAFNLKNLKNKVARVRNSPASYREVNARFPKFSLR